MNQTAQMDAARSTKAKLLAAAVESLREDGVAGISARAIAGRAEVNQALIFYHFGSVQTALLAAFDLISDRRMREYGPQLEAAVSASQLARLARRIYDDDLERGYVTALGEMVAGGVSDPVLGAEVAARIEPWIELVQRKLCQLLEGSPLLSVVVPRDLAFGVVASYFGVDMLSHLQQDRSRADSLLDLAARVADLADDVLIVPGRTAP
jgi:AcrR family transcriptional regulator